MAFRARYMCYICNEGVRVNRTILFREDAEVRKLAVKRRSELGFEDENLIVGNSRFCEGCMRSINEEIITLQEDPDPTILKVLFRHSTKCIICRREQFNRISQEARVNIFVKRGIHVPENSRVCQEHLNADGLLLLQLHNGLQSITRPIILKVRELVFLLSCLREKADNPPFKMTDEENFTDEELRDLTSLTKVQFRDLHTNYCLPVMLYGKMRNISKQFLISLLCKIRQGISDSFLRVMFGHSSRQQTSLIISKVVLSLMQNFVPQWLGYAHINREEYIRSHINDFANQLYNREPQNPKAIAYIDATYLEIQKSKNFKVLRKSFSNHKRYHLLKAVLLVAPDGYILSAHGPYFCNSANNDANILINEYEADLGRLREYFAEEDIFILDRGYRDCVQFLRDLGIHVELPANLGRLQQLSTEEANQARIITKTRWIIEARNGHIKAISKLLRDVVPNALIPHIGDIFKIVCALINKFHEPIAMQDATVKLANEMKRLAQEPNRVQNLVDQNGLLRRRGVWQGFQHEPIDFPILNLEELRHLTFGVFQINLAPSYIQDNIHEGGGHIMELDAGLNINNLLRKRIFSRHRNSTKYQTFIRYNNNRILGHYCTCRSGARVLGMYLSYARHQPHTKYPSTMVLDYVQDVEAENADGEEILPEIVQ